MAFQIRCFELKNCLAEILSTENQEKCYKSSCHKITPNVWPTGARRLTENQSKVKDRKIVPMLKELMRRLPGKGPVNL
jgi:hypothetical protein